MKRVLITHEAPTRLVPGMSLNDVIDYMQAGAQQSKIDQGLIKKVRDAKAAKKAFRGK
jgi:hypothetical protein